MRKQKGRRLLSACLAAAVSVSSFAGMMVPEITASANGGSSEMIALAKKAADESIVLMENNGALPLAKGTSVALFANSNYYMSGDGSGQTTATDQDKITIQEGLENSEALELKQVVSNYRDINAETLSGYAKECDAAIMQISRSSGEGRDRSKSKGDWYLTDEETQMLQMLSDTFDKVVVVLNTTGVIDMAWVDTYKPDAVVYCGTPGQQGGNAVADVLSGVVNPSGRLVDTWASFESYSSTANYDAYILDTETYTVDENTERRYPYWGSAPNPATGYDYGTYTRPIDEYMYTKYEEGIYVGYRYFETFADIAEGLEDAVYYPFGYGLSYTDFTISVDGFRYDTTTPSTDKNDQRITVEVTVENTGDMAGKEVVEVYYHAPDVSVGENEQLENPALELAAYDKTDMLEPGEKQTLTLSFDIKDMASWHEDIASYVLGAGDYSVYVGDSIADAKQRKAGNYTLMLGGSNLDYQVVEKLSNLAGPDMEGGVYDKYKEEYGDQITLTELSKKDYENTRPDDSECMSTSDVNLSSIPGPGQGNRYDEYNGSSDYSAELLAEIERVGALENAEYSMLDVYNGKVSMDDYLAQWEPLELIAFIEGAGNTGQMFDKSAALNGGASSTQAIPRLGVNSFRLADGPGQVGGSNEKGYSIAWPTATNLAMTWNEELVEEVGEKCGEEAIEQDTDFWLAPSLNIHRNPLCGRNYEYYSEDPLISGTMAAAIVRGAQSKGISVAIKHFAGNSTEIERWNNYDSVMSERTLREIYLKGFEITVKTADPWGLMSAYGQVNGVHCSKNTELFEILREEWGFDGAIMIDWEGDFGNTVGTILAGNNGLFPAQKGMTSYLWQAWTISQEGGTLTKTTAATKEEIGLSLTREALENAAKGMLEVMMRLKGFADNQGIAYENPYEKPDAQFTAVKSEKSTGSPAEPTAVENVIELIRAIGEVSYTDTCKNAINAAVEAYSALSEGEQAQVTNYERLLKAEIEYSVLKVDALTAAAEAAQAAADEKAEAARIQAEKAQAQAAAAQKALEEFKASQKADAAKTVITVNKKKFTVKKGKKVRIQAATSDGSRITYKSSNKKVVKVTAKGVLKGVKKGKATITMKANGVTKKVKVVVK